MISLNFLNDGNNKTLNEFHNLTDGKIMLGGSSVLKFHGIIDRKVGNLNLALNHSDVEYFERIRETCEFTFISKQDYGLKNKTYWFKKNNLNGVLFLCDDLEYDIVNFENVELRIAKIMNVKYNKEEMIKNGDSNSLKHHKDVELINKFYGIEPKKNII